MKTKHIEKYGLLLYLLQELSPGERSQVEHHLTQCPECKKKMQDEKHLIASIQKYPHLYVTEENIQKCRIQLRNRLRKEINRKSQIPFREKIGEWIPTHIRTGQLVRVTAVFVLGVIFGKWILQGDVQNGLSTREAIQALQAGVPVGLLQVNPSVEKSGFVDIRFRTMQEKVLTGNIKDPDIQYILAYALVNETRDNVRFKMIDLLETYQKDTQVQQALIHTLEHDDNPGLRLKAIKLLKSLPVNDTLKEILVSTLFRDSNPGIQHEAAEALMERIDPDILAILKQKAENDEYTRSLLKRLQPQQRISISREN